MINLFNDFRRLEALLRDAIEGGDVLNAYLFAAGMSQIVDDYLHDDPYSLARAATHLGRILPGPVGWIGSTAARRIADAIWHGRNRYRSGARIRRWQVDFGHFVMLLAENVGLRASEPSTPLRLRAALEEALPAADRLPQSLRRSMLRLPSCFRSFDQQPEDLRELARAFAREFPDRGRMLTVMGVRTSGSYLAPLLGAFLRLDGYERVQVVTYRPGQRWLRHEARVLGRAAQSGGLGLVCDDPPISGRSLSQAGHDLERLGFHPMSIVLVLQLFHQGVIPQQLQRWPVISLPWEDWAIQKRLSPAAIQRALARLRPDVQIVDVAPFEPPVAEPRRHLQAVYRVQVQLPGRSAREERVYVKGVGLGYFGEHAAAVTGALGEYVPATYGVEGGMLYRQWLPEAQRLTALPPDLSEVVGPIVGYINQRRQALAMAEDFSLRLPDRGAVWQRVAELLGRGFGRTANFARPVMHRLGKRLVGARQPSVIDGAMQLRHWFRMKGPPSTGFRKVHFEERAFSNLELYSYDPIFDLAGACTTPATAVLAEPLRKRYEGVAGAIEPERWLLHQLVHLDELERRSEEEPVVIHRAEAVAVQRYAAEVWFGDLAVPITGPVCAVDVDGVLETTGLGFSAIGPTGALALRALIRHGYRPVIATGRSLDEVRERCDAYRLAGGVAEYGAAAYNQITSTARELLTGEQRQALRRVRTMLSENGDVLVDPGYRLAVRAYYVAGPRREQLPAETIRRVLASCGEVRAIEGSYQTDFVAAGVDKGTGLLELVSELGVCRAHGASALELAVGDTMADAPMFNLAARAFAPAHAAPGLSSRVKIVRKPYQAGLSLAVASLIGHPPGQCRACHPPMPSANARLLRDALAAHDSGRLHRYRQILILAWRLSRWGE